MNVLDHWRIQFDRWMLANKANPATDAEAFDVMFLPPKEAAETLISDRLATAAEKMVL